MGSEMCIRDRRSFAEVVSDQKDYRKLIGETDDDEQKSVYVRKIGIKSLAMGVQKELDKTYTAISGEVVEVDTAVA